MEIIKTLLTAAGFIEGKTFKESRFLKPPESTYAIYLDSYTSRGSDDNNLIKEHDYTIELYSTVPDSISEKNIEDQFDNLGIEYDKDSRYWLETEQLYQVVYSFSYIEKTKE